MTQIVPAILVKDFEELRDKIKIVDGFVDWAQVDVMDGKFVDNTTWNNPADLKDLIAETSVKIEAHLMIESPWEKIDEWVGSGAKRIILHFESFGDDFEKLEEVIRKIKKADIETAIAINPETPWRSIKHFSKEIDMILMMTVEPGFGGQEFIEDVMQKIKEFKSHFPNVLVEVDGGINANTAKKAVEAGADILVSGNFIFKHPEGVAVAVAELKGE